MFKLVLEKAEWSWEKWSTTSKRMKLEYFLTPYTKINSKWIKELNVRPETVKLPEKIIGKTLSGINHSRILYDLPPKVMEIKVKINKWDLIKPKFLQNEGNDYQDEKTAFRMEENYTNEAADKELISKMYKQLLQLNFRKINDPMKKWAKEQTVL